MANRFFENTRKPTSTLGGRLMLWGMNIGHNPAAKWGLQFVDFSACAKILDIGCGGGKNIANLLKRAPDAVVCGIDYSAAAVEQSLRYNRRAAAEGRVEVLEAAVESIPYGDEEFDAVTAFETVYFWPAIQDSFNETARVLGKGGTFLICNEAQAPEGKEKWIKMLGLTIYTGEQIKGFMESAGLDGCAVHLHGNGNWLCVTGRK
jgi:ubiquinone/menaquinone biosynthesis C-methylase UbiE